MTITDEDINPYKSRRREEKVRILNENLNERSKAIESSSTTDAEAIEMIEVTSNNIQPLKMYNRIHPLLNLMTKTSYYHSGNWRGWISNLEQ